MLNRTPEALLDLATEAVPRRRNGRDRNRDPEPNSRGALTERFRNAWRMGVEGFVEAGRVLIRGKAQFPGEFLDWVERDLRLGDRKVGDRTAQRLMQIARHPVISDATHWVALPPSWRTLHELTHLCRPDENPQRMLRLIRSGKINPGMTRADARALREDCPQNPDAVFVSSMLARFERELSQFTDAQAVDNLREDPGKATPDTLANLGRRLIAIAEQWREPD